MNLLARVKLSNNYDLVINSLADTETDVEGTTVLCLVDGLSWEYNDGEWQQIEVVMDQVILSSFYPFLMSICNSIDNSFIKFQLSTIYQNSTISADKDIAVISGLSAAPKVKVDDFVLIADYVKKYTTGATVDYSSCWDREIELAEDLYGIELPDEPLEVLNLYLTTVTSLSATSLSVDNSGLDIRVSGEPQTVGVFFVSFPPDFMNAVINMLGYDMFLREDKEKRQERLGNYTYTNFEPVQYYGVGDYPSNLQNKIKFYQKIHI